MNQTLLKTAVNSLWFYKSLPGEIRFRKSLANPAVAQEDILMRIIRRNQDTEYGKQFQFSKIQNRNNFQMHIPVTRYEDYEFYIQKIGAGKDQILTKERVILFEPTGGSTGIKKYIPWTKSLNQEFQMGISPWIVSLFKKYPAVRSGSAYWAVSPPVKRSKYENIPVGFSHDSEYLGFFGKWLYPSVAVLPNFTKDSLSSVIHFKKATLAALLLREDLSLISVWSPSLLYLLLDFLENSPEEAVRSVYGVCKKRAGKIETLISKKESSDLYRTLWPNLKLISCWSDGSSREIYQLLKKRMEGIDFQGKGLIATEAFISLPFVEGKDPVLSVNSHFFEFEDAVNGEICRAESVKKDRQYSVIVTTSGGLYRYRMNDLILVTGFYKKTPCMRFLSRDSTSDLFGEKLHHRAAQEMIQSVRNHFALKNSFAFLYPQKLQSSGRYVLFLDQSESFSCREIADYLEAKLQEHFHYKLCRQTGQLLKAGLFQIFSNTKDPHVLYHEALGQADKTGDVKFLPVDGRLPWTEIFSGELKIYDETSV
ncbi:MAG: GH3 auxin-responsive promoter family protein [Spirochaetia bacterium]|nr:GH3 auxin-responsive promoter family protein [Spirochaetia bacterium]